MNLLEIFHGGYVHRRRVRVLAGEIADLLPDQGHMLDVGCGDGLLASVIQSKKPGVTVTGIDVMARPGTHIPVTEFDGYTIPFPDRSFESVIFVDVLHHTNHPAVLLREAVRVARESIVLKDHTRDGIAAEITLRFMDRTGNRRHHVALPHNYWPEKKWFEVFNTLGLTVRTWKSRLGLYPPPADWLFGRSLHFVAQLAVPGGRLAVVS